MSYVCHKGYYCPQGKSLIQCQPSPTTAKEWRLSSRIALTAQLATSAMQMVSQTTRAIPVLKEISAHRSACQQSSSAQLVPITQRLESGKLIASHVLSAIIAQRLLLIRFHAWTELSVPRPQVLRPLARQDTTAHHWSGHFRAAQVPYSARLHSQIRIRSAKKVPIAHRTQLEWQSARVALSEQATEELSIWTMAAWLATPDSIMMPLQKTAWSAHLAIYVRQKQLPWCPKIVLKRMDAYTPKVSAGLKGISV